MSVIRITLTSQYLGQNMQNVMHFNNPDDALTLSNCCTEIRDQWCVRYKEFMASGAFIANIKAERVDNPPNPAPVNLAVAISGVGEPTAPHICCAMIIQLRTAAGGRSGRGRIYTPAPRGGWFSNSQLSSAGIGYINSTLLPALMGWYGFGGTRPLHIVVAKKNNPADYRDVTSMSVNPIYGIQRRRNLGVGI